MMEYKQLYDARRYEPPVFVARERLPGAKTFYVQTGFERRFIGDGSDRFSPPHV
jgi:hypothetical protein